MPSRPISPSDTCAQKWSLDPAASDVIQSLQIFSVIYISRARGANHDCGKKLQDAYACASMWVLQMSF